MATSITVPSGTNPAVNTATTGALSGDGTSGSKLSVAVDGTTIDVNGSNQLEVIAKLSLETLQLNVDSASAGAVFLVDGSTAPTFAATPIDFEPGLLTPTVIALNQVARGIYNQPYFSTHASGTHASIYGATFEPPQITDNGATVTTSASLHVGNAPSVGTNKYSLLVDQGARFNGSISVGSSAGVSAGPFTTISSITVVNGIVTALTGS